VTGLGRISKADLDRLKHMAREEASVTIRNVLSMVPGRCTACNATVPVRPRPGTSYAGICECGGAIELLHP
jgi:hypothetical protein